MAHVGEEAIPEANSATAAALPQSLSLFRSSAERTILLFVEKTIVRVLNMNAQTFQGLILLSRASQRFRAGIMEPKRWRLYRHLGLIDLTKHTTHCTLTFNATLGI
jgi:hypothetical protein